MPVETTGEVTGKVEVFVVQLVETGSVMVEVMVMRLVDIIGVMTGIVVIFVVQLVETGSVRVEVLVVQLVETSGIVGVLRHHAGVTVTVTVTNGSLRCSSWCEDTGSAVSTLSTPRITERSCGNKYILLASLLPNGKTRPKRAAAKLARPPMVMSCLICMLLRFVVIWAAGC